MGTLSERASTTLRYYARRSVYSLGFSGLFDRMMEKRAAARSRSEAWDDQLTGAKAAYMNRTFSITARDALTVSMLRIFAPSIESVWDIGCAKGTLAGALQPVGCRRYEGVDISRVAIAAAGQARDAAPNEYPETTVFSEGRMGECRPQDGRTVDAVVFNEVIYYLPTPCDAAAEVARVFEFVAPKGVVSISMKDDAKSSAIVRELSRRFAYLHSVLFQEQIVYPSFRVRLNRQRPAYLICLFGRPQDGSSPP